MLHTMAGGNGGNDHLLRFAEIANGKRDEATPTRHDGFHDLRSAKRSIGTDRSVFAIPDSSIQQGGI